MISILEYGLKLGKMNQKHYFAKGQGYFGKKVKF
jgi:hypothetical protein